jgi:hypothetical protein
MLFHLCVLAKWIPHTMVWGSRIKTNRELYVFEIISLLVTGENSDESEPPIPVKVSHLQMVVG